MIAIHKKISHGWLLFVFIVMFFSSLGTITATENRIIHFPQDHQIGNLYLVDRIYPKDDFWAWLSVSDPCWLSVAQGDVKVPADKWLKLDVIEKAWSRPRPFAGLKPDDIQILDFSTYSNADASVLEDVGQLTGLERY
jgi:hypothetical protein